MAKTKKKQEALSVSRLINEVLVAQLSIPLRQIVNDTAFSKYTGSKRPDILISEFEYDGTNDEQYIKNLVAYAEAKDDCKVDDKDWKDALKQGKNKAPKYTKEKTYALFIKKRSGSVTKIQEKPIWMYIIDNDGLANSDKRFPTKLRNNRNGWMHDEISGWVSTDGIEMPGLLENRWLKFDDLDSTGTDWINDKGIPECQRKGGNIPIDKIIKNEYCTLLPEYYIRPYKPSYLDKNELISELNDMQNWLPKINLSQLANEIESVNLTYSEYQARQVPIASVIDKMSGNSGLTEEFIYHAMQNQGEKYVVLSSATEDRTKMGEIPVCTINNKPLKVFENREGLLVTRNGKAGMTRFLPKGKYTINDHAYILYVRDDSPYSIDLRWLAIQYRTEFLQFASSSDNGTWNMTGFFNQVKIDIPIIKEQKALVNIYDKLMYVQKIFSNLDTSVSRLFEKQVVVKENG